MSDRGRAGRDRGTSDVEAAARTLQEYAMRAQERAEVLAARIERREVVAAHLEDEFVAAARRLDLEVSAFIVDMDSGSQGPPDPSIVVTLQLVGTALDITRRTVDLMIGARSPRGPDEHGGDDAPGP